MLVMENAEEVMQILERFTRLKQKEIPKELDDYFHYVAKTGDTVFKWANLKYLFREKLLNVIKNFHDTTPRVDEIPQYPNVDPFNYENMKSALLERLELFNAAPFTIQRLCELLIDPRKQYSRIDKFMRALEKNILVSTIEPGRKRSESENGDSLDSVVNGDLSLDVNVDIDMEGEPLFNMESAQNGDGPRVEETNADINLSDEPETKQKVNSGPNKKEHSPSPDDEAPVAKKVKLDTPTEESKQKVTEAVKIQDSSEINEKSEEVEAETEKNVTQHKSETKTIDVSDKNDEDKTEELNVREKEESKQNEIEPTKEEKAETLVQSKEGDKVEKANDKPVEDTLVNVDDENKENQQVDIVKTNLTEKVIEDESEESAGQLVKNSDEIKKVESQESSSELENIGTEKKKEVEIELENQVTDSSIDVVKKKDNTSEKLDENTPTKDEEVLECEKKTEGIEQTTDIKSDITTDHDTTIDRKETKVVDDSDKKENIEKEKKEETVENVTPDNTITSTSNTEKTVEAVKPLDEIVSEEVQKTNDIVQKEETSTSNSDTPPISIDSNSTTVVSGIEDEISDVSKTVIPQLNVIAPALVLNDQPMEDLPVDETESTVNEVVMSENGGTVEMATDGIEPSKEEPAGMDIDDTSQEAMDQ